MIEYRTGLAALKAIGTAMTLVLGGLYLDQRGFVNPAFSRYVQQLGLPLYFFSKIVECPPLMSSSTRRLPENEGHQYICPSVLDFWSEAWILVLWPFVVIPCGLLVGHCAACISGAPKRHRNAIVLSTGFANSGSLPATLLAVLSQHDDGRSTFKGDTISPALGPNAFLSLCLIFAPMLLWSLGFWLAQPLEDDKLEATDDGQEEETERQTSSRGYGSIAQSESLREANTNFLKEGSGSAIISTSATWLESSCFPRLANVMQKSFQPPVIGAVVGLIVVLLEPVRRILVESDSLLAWFFGGLTLLGQSSIPLSMCVLGMSVSSSIKFSRSTENRVETFTTQTIAGIIAGKMIVMPAIGLVLFWFLREIVNIQMPPPMALVVLIQWCTPTANNVTVMCDLAGGMQEAVAQLMLWEYAFAPILLSISMSLVIKLSGFDA